MKHLLLGAAQSVFGVLMVLAVWLALQNRHLRAVLRATLGRYATLRRSLRRRHSDATVTPHHAPSRDAPPASGTRKTSSYPPRAA